MDTSTVAPLGILVNETRIDLAIPILTLANQTGIPRANLKRFFDGKGDLTVGRLKLLSTALNTPMAVWGHFLDEQVTS